MPELPEVETVVRQIAPLLAHRKIEHFQALWPKVTAPTPPDDFAREVAGATIQKVRRRGKFILLELGSGLIHIHLRMTGKLLVLPAVPDEPHPHDTATFDLAEGGVLVFRDQRKFGRMGFLSDPVPLESRLGPEPLAPQFTPDKLASMLKARARQIKPLLLDQAFLAGLGNIYVDEALFLAKIHPLSRADSVDLPRVERLHAAIQQLLSASIQQGGTTIINFESPDGQPGRFRERLQVFGQQGKPCPVCGTEVQKIRVGQRGTHFCPMCQPVPE